MTPPSQKPTLGVTFRTDGNVAIHVPDLAKAEDFYANVLGFRLVDRSADLLHFDTGVLQLYVRQDAAALLPFIPAIEVPEYQRAKEYLERAGCRIIHEWEGGKALYFQDPFGLLLDIIERAQVRRPARRVKRKRASVRPRRRAKSRRSR